MRYVLASLAQYNEAFEEAMKTRGDLGLYCSKNNAAQVYFLAEDGKSGYCLEDNGEYVGGIFSHADYRGRLGEMLEHAAGLGRIFGHSIQTLDCYAPLGPIYSRHGYEEMHRVPWPDDYKPEGWPDSLGKPDVIMMTRYLV